ncbi:Adenylate cyclase 1 [bacterium HR40]|nr:Adenylate cyclase 1 [bacterium HR40]
MPEHPAALVRWLGMAAILGVATGVAALVDLFTPLRALENVLDDLRLVYLDRPRSQHPFVAMVVIDERSLAARSCRSPIDRDLLADLVAEIAKRQPLAIGLDVLFDRPGEPTADARLRDRLATLAPPAVLAAPAVPPADPERAAFLASMLAVGEMADASLLLEPVDGFVRAVPLRDDAGRLGFAAALAARAGVVLPEERELRIRWRLGPDPRTPPFRVYPAFALPWLPADWLANRIVLVGAILEDSDRWPTLLSRLPGAPSLTGLEIHAQALAQLLDGESHPRAAPLLSALVVLMAAASGLWLAARTHRPRTLAFSLPLVGCAWLAVGLAGQPLGLGLLPVAPTLLALAIATGSGIAVYRRAEWRQRRQLERAFAHYLAPAVVRRIAARPDRLERAAERSELTVLFSDLEGFTPLSEQLPPEQVAELLAGYFDGLVETVFAHEGTVDKIVGDGMHVLFGAPEPQPDDAARAVRCALAMLDVAAGHRALWMRRGVALGRTRIGIARGPVLVGHFGASHRFDYTAHGDVVNTAARLEQANKLLGTVALVSESVVLRCPELVFRPVGVLQLRGKREPVRAFEPLASRPEWLADWERAFAATAEGQEDALALFQELLPRLPEDPVLRFVLDRLTRGQRGERFDLA